jgi:hypothetical protein
MEKLIDLILKRLNKKNNYKMIIDRMDKEGHKMMM